VRIGTIYLTPENPVYDVGAWHVEGMRNEKIISTGIYYYDQENITNSHLAFRQAVKERSEMSYERSGIAP